jgi:hypothetical protein
LASDRWRAGCFAGGLCPTGKKGETAAAATAAALLYESFKDSTTYLLGLESLENAMSYLDAGMDKLTSNLPFHETDLNMEFWIEDLIFMNFTCLSISPQNPINV